ncbi:hypothetical protein L3Q82_017916, partial [Scortum barcoo]
MTSDHRLRPDVARDEDHGTAAAPSPEATDPPRSLTLCSLLTGRRREWRMPSSSCSIRSLSHLDRGSVQVKSELCHVQKFGDGRHSHRGPCCSRSGQEDEYRELIQDFVTWCDSNRLPS